jgi:transposase
MDCTILVRMVARAGMRRLPGSGTTTGRKTAGHRKLLSIVRDDRLCRQLMTVPGVGPVVSLAYSSTVDIPARFKNSKAVGAALRLTPILNQSGESNRVGRISLCGDAMMRTLLYEAAQVMLTRVTKWSWLKAWAMNIARRRCLWLLDRRPRLSST